MKTKDECKRILSKIGFELGISPRWISERLLSPEDKRDMLDGNLPPEVLKLHVELWIRMGCPWYSKGETKADKAIALHPQTSNRQPTFEGKR